MARRRGRRSASPTPATPADKDRDAPKISAPRWPRLDRPTLSILGLLGLGVLTVYGRTWWFEFQDLDDLVNVRDHPYLRPWGRESLGRIWSESYTALYAPVTYTWWALVAWASPTASPPAPPGTLSPAWFHAGNVVWHLLATGAVFWIARQLLGDSRAAALGAGLFALHPLHVESVAWITEAKGLISTSFGLWAIALWLAAFPPPLPPADVTAPPAARSRLRGALGYAASTLAFGLALLAKPSAVAIPLVIACLELGWRRQPWRRVAPGLAPWLLAALALAIYTKVWLQADEQLDPRLAEVSWWGRVLVAGDAITFYLGKLAWPLGLAPDYARDPTSVLDGGTPWLAWLVPLALTLAATRLPNPRRGLALWGIWCVALLPVLGLVPFGFQQYSTVADRYAYLALLAPSLGVAWLYHGRTTAVGYALGAGVVVVWAVLSYRQTGLWRDTPTLFTHTLAVSPRSYLAPEKLASRLLREGRPAEAAAYYRAALEWHPQRAELSNKLGSALSQLGRRDEAEVAFRRALEADPDLPEAHYNLASSFAARGESDQALPHFRRAIELRPNYLAAHNNLGVLHLGRGEYSAAEAEFRALLELAPNHAQAHYNLAGVYDKTGNVRGAIFEYAQALAAQPGWGDAAVRLAWLWSTAPDPRLRNPAEAIRLAEELCRATNNAQPVTLDTLGVALAAAGRFPEAIAAAEQAQALATQQGKADLAGRIQERIGLYRAGKPYLQPR